MKKYPLSELVKRWEREELTVEQAVGQILLWLASLSEQVNKNSSQHKGQQSKAG